MSEKAPPEPVCEVCRHANHYECDGCGYDCCNPAPSAERTESDALWERKAEWLRGEIRRAEAERDALRAALKRIRDDFGPDDLWCDRCGGEYDHADGCPVAIAREALGGKS
jgi:hypothetical protein